MRHQLMALGILISSAAIGQGPLPNLPDAVRDKDTAYILLPPVAVQGPLVSRLSWSSNGEFLAMLAHSGLDAELELTEAYSKGHLLAADPQPKRTSFQIWDRKSRTIRTLWTGADSISYQWVDGASFGFAIIREPDTVEAKGSISLVRFDAKGQWTGLVTQHPVPEGSISSNFVPLQDQPAAIYWQSKFAREQTQSEAWIVSATEMVPIIPPAGYQPGLFFTSEKSEVIALVQSVLDRQVREYHQFDVKTKKFTRLPADYRPPSNFRPREREGVWLELGSARATPEQGEGVAGTQSLWLATDRANEPAALVCGDVPGSGSLAPTRDAVAYLCQGALFVRPILKLPAADFNSKLLEELKKAAMMTAKAIALAMGVYAADNEGKFPSNQQPYARLLAPYLSALAKRGMDQFAYVFRGGSLGDALHSETILGYIAGPGGYAVAFADGHVEWRTQV